MNDSELLERAESLLDLQKQSFDGEAWQQALIIGPEKSTFMSIDPAMMSSIHSKDQIRDVIRAEAKKLKAEAVLFFSDMWIGHQTEAQRAQARSLQFMSGHSMAIPELAKAGLATRREALCVMILEPKRTRQLLQFYQRTPDGRIVWEERTASDNNAAFAGRFVEIWE